MIVLRRHESPAALEESIRELCDGLPQSSFAIFHELRAIVGMTIPDATEKVNLGWRSLNFSHPEVGYFCGLFPREDFVEVVFEFGVLLPDPAGLFDRLARQVGCIRIRSRNDIRKAALTHLLREAVALPADRNARLELVRLGARRRAH